jgi:hypothetical protein
MKVPAAAPSWFSSATDVSRETSVAENWPVEEAERQNRGFSVMNLRGMSHVKHPSQSACSIF